MMQPGQNGRGGVSRSESCYHVRPRLVAAALAIEMLVALLFVHLPKGYAAGGGGYEYVLLIGAVCFVITIRGGGPYSVDRAIGKKL
jgi:putative oxidoreductase